MKSWFQFRLAVIKYGCPSRRYRCFWGLPVRLGMHNDIYFKVGLLTTIGLVSCKNAILIVEFAKALHEQGEDIPACC